MGLFSSSLSSVRKRFIDIFSSRSNTTGSLGTATDGSQWEAVSKVIEVQGGKAVANYVPQPADDGSEYPIAVIDMPTQNNIITLEDTDIGSGVALWVQTSSDWWMVSVDSAYNTIPAATNYTSAPATFSGQVGYTMETMYSSSEAGFSAGDVYSMGVPTYSILPAEYSSGTTSYTAGLDTYTSSVDTFSSTPTFSSSTPYSSLQPFSSAQVFSSLTPFSSVTNYFSQNNAYTSFANFTSLNTWNRWSPYTLRPASNSSQTFYNRNYTRRATPLAYTGSTWSRGTGYTSVAAGWSRQDFWNLATAYTSTINGVTASQSWTSSGPFYSAGTTTYTSAAPTYSAGTTEYTAGLDVYTGATFYTLSPGGFFSSATQFSSTTPFSSATPYSSATTFSSSTNYFADLVFSSGLTYSSGTSYTSAISYSSTFVPESFAYSAILRISQSVSDTVSEISSAIVSTAQTIKSIIVQTSGNQITAKAFSDVTPITQIGDDLIYNATGVIINTKYGISISKAEYTNNEIGSSVKIERG
jgi:hypothetical protein